MNELLVSAWVTMPIIDFSVWWEFIKGNLSREELCKYENTDWQTMSDRIKNGDINKYLYTSYINSMNEIFGNKKTRHRYNFVPYWHQYFLRRATRRHPSNGRPAKQYHILPNKFAGPMEMGFWIKEILVLDIDQIARLDRYKWNGIQSKCEILGHLLGLLNRFGQP